MAHGLEKTGRIVTSAALIIVVVAGSFTFTSIVITKALGVGLAVAVALDATVIRILMVPAAMRLLGRWNWWLPGVAGAAAAARRVGTGRRRLARRRPVGWPMSSLADNLAALREPEFRKLFLGQAASVVGTMLTIVALPFAVLEIGGTATDIGIVEAAYFLPMVLMVAVGGVWADRLDRRKVMLVVDLARTVLQLATAGLLLAGLAEVWMLVVMHAAAGVGDAFFRPAYTGLVPQVVSAGRLQQANALQGLVQSGSITLGAATGGLLVAAMGAGWAIGIDGCTFLVSAWFLCGCGRAPSGRPPPGARGRGRRCGGRDGRPRGRTSTGFLADLRLGWREFTSHTWLWVMVTGASVFLMTVEAPLDRARADRGARLLRRRPDVGLSRRRRWAWGRSSAAWSRCAGARGARSSWSRAG